MNFHKFKFWDLVQIFSVAFLLRTSLTGLCSGYIACQVHEWKVYLFVANLLPSQLQPVTSHLSCRCEKSSQWLGKKSCFGAGVAKPRNISMGESNTIVSAYTLYRHLQ